jgi:hypothetical protein
MVQEIRGGKFVAGQFRAIRVITGGRIARVVNNANHVREHKKTGKKTGESIGVVRRGE